MAIIRIYKLISDLIYLHHPITLDIRYLFCQRLSGGQCWNSREEWEAYIKDGCGDYTLTSFLRLLWKDKYFRHNVIEVLEMEKDGIIKSS